MSKRGERHRGMALRDSEASRKPGGPRHWLICSTPITMMPEHTQTARGCPRWFVHQTTRLVMNSAEGGSRWSWPRGSMPLAVSGEGNACVPSPSSPRSPQVMLLRRSRDEVNSGPENETNNEILPGVGLISPPMSPTAIGPLTRVRIGDAQPIRRLVGPCRAAL
jgi:hypothetical protein